MSAMGKFTMGFIMGGLASTAVALLLTPKSGIELRDQIKDYIENVQNEVRQAQDERRLEMNLELESLKHPKS